MAYTEHSDDDDLDLGYAASEVKKEIELLPAGEYLCIIEKVKVEQNQAEDIKSANIRFAVISGEYEKKKIFARHCVATKREGENMATMQRIGREQVGELMRAAGVGGSSLAPLLGKTVLVKLSVRPERTDEKTGRVYDESNDVRGYKPKPAAKGAKTTPAPAAALTKPKSGAPSFIKPKPPAAPQETEAEDEPADENAAD